MWKSSGCVIQWQVVPLSIRKVCYLHQILENKSLILLNCVNRNSAKETRKKEKKHLHLTSECTWSWFGGTCKIYFALTQSEPQRLKQNCQKGFSISIIFDFSVSWPFPFTTKFICRYAILWFCLRKNLKATLVLRSWNYNLLIQQGCQNVLSKLMP